MTVQVLQGSRDETRKTMLQGVDHFPRGAVTLLQAVSR
jgi:hypothetical protein